MGGISIRLTRGSVLIAVLGMSFLGISQTTGAGWVMVLVALCVALLLIGVAGPVWALRRPSLAIDVPADAMVGTTTTIGVEVLAPSGGATVEIVGLAAPAAVFAPTRGRVKVMPERRGIVESLNVKVSSGAPLGLVNASRIVKVAPQRIMAVAPRPIPQGLPPDHLSYDRDGDGAPVSAIDGDVVGGLREYRYGDQPKLIHWPATARRGTLVTKELDVPSRPALDVVVVLKGGRDRQEEVAGRAAGLIRSALAAGIPVTMHTRERDGIRSECVQSARLAGRRLAHAVAGEVAVAPGAGLQIVMGP